MLRKLISQAVILALVFSIIFNGNTASAICDTHNESLQATNYTVEYSNAVTSDAAEITLMGVEIPQNEATVTYGLYSVESDEVEEKVDAVYSECQKAGISGEYETALWLHDWIIYNASYDYTYTEYNADGVLLKGTGVCQSYALAYQLLLNKAGIANDIIYSYEMNHAWNLVYLDGEWCHVDCTWDDPESGGLENRIYFGMNDELISRDHQWQAEEYVSCTSLDNYYLLRSGGNVCRNLNEFYAVLDRQAQERGNEFTIDYIGSDSTFNMMEAFNDWFMSRMWIFGFTCYEISSGGYSITATVEYSELPTQFTEPVECPDFTLVGPNGTYSLSDYYNNGLILIFGASGYVHTDGIMDYLYGKLKQLHSDGIEVLVCLSNVTDEEDLGELTEMYPDYCYAFCNYEALYDIFGAVFPDDTGFSYPLVVTVGKDNIINYAYTLFVYDLDGFMTAVNDNATDFAIPNYNSDNLKGDVNGDYLIDENDLLILTHYLACWEGTTLENTDNADINGDGKITPVDRAVLARYLAGWDGYAQYFA